MDPKTSKNIQELILKLVKYPRIGPETSKISKNRS